MGGICWMAWCTPGMLKLKLAKPSVPPGANTGLSTVDHSRMVTDRKMNGLHARTMPMNVWRFCFSSWTLSGQGAPGSRNT